MCPEFSSSSDQVWSFAPMPQPGCSLQGAEMNPPQSQLYTFSLEKVNVTLLWETNQHCFNTESDSSHMLYNSHMTQVLWFAFDFPSMQKIDFYPQYEVMLTSLMPRNLINWKSPECLKNITPFDVLLQNEIEDILSWQVTISCWLDTRIFLGK